MYRKSTCGYATHFLIGIQKCSIEFWQNLQKKTFCQAKIFVSFWENVCETINLEFLSKNNVELVETCQIRCYRFYRKQYKSYLYDIMIEWGSIWDFNKFLKISFILMAVFWQEDNMQCNGIWKLALH
jgi:hypothetical protein